MGYMKGSRLQLYLFGLLAGNLLAGCTAGSVEEVVRGDSTPVTLSFGKPDLGVLELMTRAGEDIISVPTPLPEGATVRIAAYFTGYAGETQQQVSFSTDKPSFEATYVVGDDGTISPCCVDGNGKQAAGEAKGLTVRGGVYDFYAVSPARPLQLDGDGYYKITGIPHKEDVMTSFVRKVEVSKNSHQVTLGTFQRKCALVVFNVAPSPGNALAFKKLYGTKLIISKIASTGANLIAGSDTGIPLTGGSSGDGAKVIFESTEFEKVEEASDPDKIGLNKTKGVLLPKNNQAFEVEIGVQRDDETATLRATIGKDITFDEGKRYVFTLEVKNSESSLIMRVLDWNMVAFTDNSVGAAQPDPDPDINEGIGAAVVVAKWPEISGVATGMLGGNK